MNRGQAPARAELAHTAALGVWLGVLAMSGVTAAIIFPTMKSLQPTLGAYSAFDGEHWRLAAGIVQARVFAVADTICAVLAIIAVVTLALAWLRTDFGSWLGRARILAVVVACIALGNQLFVLGPTMSQNVRRYWAEAAAGNNRVAEQARQAFEADHPAASRTLGVQFGAAGIALLLGIIHRPRRIGVQGG